MNITIWKANILLVFSKHCKCFAPWQIIHIELSGGINDIQSHNRNCHYSQLLCHYYLNFNKLLQVLTTKNKQKRNQKQYSIKQQKIHDIALRPTALHARRDAPG